jgi:hypothetical protein
MSTACEDLAVISSTIARLADLGIERVFGVPSDGAFHIDDAIERSDRVTWVGCSNELNGAETDFGGPGPKTFGPVAMKDVLTRLTGESPGLRSLLQAPLRVRHKSRCRGSDQLPVALRSAASVLGLP